MFGRHPIRIIPLLKERVRDTADASKLRRKKGLEVRMTD